MKISEKELKLIEKTTGEIKDQETNEKEVGLQKYIKDKQRINQSQDKNPEKEVSLSKYVKYLFSKNYNKIINKDQEEKCKNFNLNLSKTKSGTKSVMKKELYKKLSTE